MFIHIMQIFQIGKSASRCPTGWEKYNNHCYYVSTDKTKNWYKSEVTILFPLFN